MQFVRPRLMGIVNVTPDSFSDGGLFLDPRRAVAHARRLVADGTDVLDIGGESTRPGYTPVSSDDEIARVVPVLRGLTDVGVPRSIDTSKAAVARAAIAAGATMVNDVWGLTRDPAMAAVCADADVDVVAMHNREDIDATIDILGDIDRRFDASLALATRAGVAAARVILDPGIGFGKTPAQNIAALMAVPRWRARSHRVLIGASRKRIIGTLTGRHDVQAGERLAGTLVAHLRAAMLGADFLRIHDVAEHRDALAVWAALA